MAPLTFNLGDQTEGGDFPRGNLVVTAARFDLYEYKDKEGKPVKSQFGGDAKTMAAILDLQNEEGTVFPQVYSVGSPDRFQPGNGGTTLDGPSINKRCNFAKLIQEMVRVGYPDDRFDKGGDITKSFVGLSAYWDQGSETDKDSRLILPQEIFKYPWDSETPSSAAPTATAQAPVSGDALTTAVKMVNGMLSNGTDATRKALSMAAFGDDVPEEHKQAIMNLVFSTELVDELGKVGITLDSSGERFVR